MDYTTVIDYLSEVIGASLSGFGDTDEKVNKAKEACEMAQQSISDHFVGVNKMVSVGSGAEREVEDIMLSRYACYLIVMNGELSLA